jgi:HTH-type transcriptional regulator / antitoxin HigA
MNVFPIRTEENYDVALMRIDQLMNAELGTPEGDELDILVTLVEAYEAKHYPMPICDPVEAIKFRMEQMGLVPKDLTPIIGSRSKVSEVLNHKRQLSIAMIRNLHARLNVPYESLIGA